MSQVNLLSIQIQKISQEKHCNPWLFNLGQLANIFIFILSYTTILLSSICTSYIVFFPQILKGKTKMLHFLRRKIWTVTMHIQNLIIIIFFISFSSCFSIRFFFVFLSEQREYFEPQSWTLFNRFYLKFNSERTERKGKGCHQD